MNGEISVLSHGIGLWAEAMGRACWQGGWALGLAAVLCRPASRLSPHVRCWLWRLAALKLLAALWWMPSLDLPLLPARLVTPAPAPLRMPDLRVLPLCAPSLHVPVPRVAVHCGAGLLLIWLLGVGWFGIGFGREAAASRCRRAACRPLTDARLTAACRELCGRLGLRRAPRLLVAAGDGSPWLEGIYRPAIILPQALLPASSRRELRLMLAHELAHLKRRDLLWGWLATLAHGLFFFHPLVWLAGREWRLAQEMACDEIAMRITNAPADEYGGALLRVAAQRGPALRAGPAALGVLESYDTLKRRLIMMQTMRVTRRAGSAGRGLLALGLLGLLPWRVVVQDKPVSHRRAAHRTASAVRPSPPRPALLSRLREDRLASLGGEVSIVERQAGPEDGQAGVHPRAAAASSHRRSNLGRTWGASHPARWSHRASHPAPAAPRAAPAVRRTTPSERSLESRRRTVAVAPRSTRRSGFLLIASVPGGDIPPLLNDSSSAPSSGAAVAQRLNSASSAPSDGDPRRQRLNDGSSVPRDGDSPRFSGDAGAARLGAPPALAGDTQALRAYDAAVATDGLAVPGALPAREPDRAAVRGGGGGAPAGLPSHASGGVAASTAAGEIRAPFGLPSPAAAGTKQVDGVNPRFLAGVPRAEPRVYNGPNPAEAGWRTATEPRSYSLGLLRALPPSTGEGGGVAGSALRPAATVPVRKGEMVGSALRPAATPSAMKGGMAGSALRPAATPSVRTVPARPARSRLVPQIRTQPDGVPARGRSLLIPQVEPQPEGVPAPAHSPLVPRTGGPSKEAPAPASSSLVPWIRVQANRTPAPARSPLIPEIRTQPREPSMPADSPLVPSLRTRPEVPARELNSAPPVWVRPEALPAPERVRMEQEGGPIRMVLLKPDTGRIMGVLHGSRTVVLPVPMPESRSTAAAPAPLAR